VTGVIVVHPSPTDLRATYAGLHGDAAVRLDRDRLIVKLGDDTISLLAPKAFKSRFPTIPIPEIYPKGGSRARRCASARWTRSRRFCCRRASPLRAPVGAPSSSRSNSRCSGRPNPFKLRPRRRDRLRECAGRRAAARRGLAARCGPSAAHSPRGRSARRGWRFARP
jgi:hypothetical protein